MDAEPYLDWVLMDALMAAEIIATFQVFTKARYGAFYTVIKTRWKAELWRICRTPISFCLGWIAPGAFCYRLYGTYPKTSLAIAGIYYFLNLLFVLRYIGALTVRMLRRQKSPRRIQAELMSAMVNAYAQLREETIHVPSLQRAIEQAREVGVVWDPQVFSLFDGVAARTPSTWTLRLSA